MQKTSTNKCLFEAGIYTWNELSLYSQLFQFFKIMLFHSTSKVGIFITEKIKINKSLASYGSPVKYLMITKNKNTI